MDTCGGETDVVFVDVEFVVGLGMLDNAEAGVMPPAPCGRVWTKAAEGNAALENGSNTEVVKPRSTKTESSR